MKSNGKSTKDGAIYGPLVLKRGKEDIVFYAQPVWSLDEFNDLCPVPENRDFVYTKTGKQVDHESPDYKVQLKDYAAKRWGWTIMKTLEPSFVPTGSLEWETVNPSDPKTWANAEQELRDSFAHFEFGRIMDLVEEANVLDDAKLEENVRSFFIKAKSEDEKAKSSISGPPANE